MSGIGSKRFQNPCLIAYEINFHIILLYFGFSINCDGCGKLEAGNWGCAQTSQDGRNVFAVAMESSDIDDVKFIESVVL